MSVRMAFAERPLELATDWPLHSGRLMVAAIACPVLPGLGPSERDHDDGRADDDEAEDEPGDPPAGRPDGHQEPVDHVGHRVRVDAEQAVRPFPPAIR